MKKISKTKLKKIEQDIVDTIKKNNITFFDEIFTILDFSPSIFYDNKLNELNSIKDEIEKNRAILKRELRNKWFESTNATLNAALYKLICTDEEKRALSSSANKTSQNNEICTQEEYLKSLKEMGEGIENAD